MQTHVMDPTAASTAWLEIDSPEDTSPRRVMIEALPFIIGRSDACELTVDSVRVSREHAEIIVEDGAYRVRDLGSTNGTHVNGESVEEAALNDGDILLVADTELTFGCSHGDGAAGAATQPLTDVLQATDAEVTARDMVRQVRSLQEMLISAAIPVQLDPVVELQSRRRVALSARDPWESRALAGNPAAGRIMGRRCSLALRLRQLHRVLAWQQSRGADAVKTLFLPLSEGEYTGSRPADWLPAAAYASRDDRALALAVHACGDAFESRFAAARASLTEHGVLLACVVGPDEFRRAKHLAQLAPDFVIFHERVIRGLHRSRERARRLKPLCRMLRDGGTATIACGLTRDAEAELCHDVGIDLGLGRLFARSHSVPGLSQEMPAGSTRIEEAQSPSLV